MPPEEEQESMPPSEEQAMIESENTWAINLGQFHLPILHSPVVMGWSQRFVGSNAVLLGTFAGLLIGSTSLTCMWYWRASSRNNDGMQHPDGLPHSYRQLMRGDRESQSSIWDRTLREQEELPETTNLATPLQLSDDPVE